MKNIFFPHNKSSDIKIFSVTEISNEISSIIKNSFNFIGIKGEISNLNKSSSGHIYFSIKDSKNIMDAVCFAGIARNLNFNLENGLEVILFGEIDCYQSKYQIKVKFIQLSGIGEMIKILEERKSRLSKAGIFDSSRKKLIPKFINKIGLITSASGAVIHDIITRLEDRLPVNLLVHDSLVQGETAPKNIIQGIQYFNENSVDVIIIARGGGSFEDLFCFNDENLVMEIYNSKIPVISAIGHDLDYTLCDFVSDLRAPTPTAAAEMLVPRKDELLSQIDSLVCKSNLSIERILEINSDFLENLKQRCNLFIEKIKNIEIYIAENKIYGSRNLKNFQEKLNSLDKLVKERVNYIEKMLFSRIESQMQSVVLITKNVYYNINGMIQKCSLNLNAVYISPNKIRETIKFRVENICNKIENKLNWKIDNYERNLSNLSIKCDNKINLLLENKSTDIKNIFSTIQSCNHIKILKKGYAILSNVANGDHIKSIKDIKNKMILAIKMHDGRVDVAIKINTYTIGGLLFALLGLLFFI